MISNRQERKSCEACRARKLRCSGEKSGCSRCRSLSLTCKFKDKGVPGRPRKRPRQELQEQDFLSRGDRTGSSSSSNVSPTVRQDTFESQQALSMLMNADELNSLPCGLSGNCEFNSFDWEMLANAETRTFPNEVWQSSRNNGSREFGVSSMALDAYVSPMSFSQSCQCDEEVSRIVRNLDHMEISHDTIQLLRTGVSLTERLLTCPTCYDVSKPPRVTVQNVLLIGQLMFAITAGYERYIRWLKTYCTELDNGNDTETIYLDSGFGMPSDFSLQLSGERFQDLVMHGLKADAEQLMVLGGKFAQRQRNRHMVGHETCPDPEGRCRRKGDGFDYDPLDLCLQEPVARKLMPCFRIVDEVRGMIKGVADAVV